MIPLSFGRTTYYCASSSQVILLLVVVRAGLPEYYWDGITADEGQAQAINAKGGGTVTEISLACKFSNSLLIMFRVPIIMCMLRLSIPSICSIIDSMK